MRPRNACHLDAPHSLGTIDTGHISFFQPSAPGRVRKNHHFGHEQIQRISSSASLQFDFRILVFALQAEVPVNASDGFGSAANFFAIFQKFLGELPKPNELGAIRNRKVALLNSFFRHLIGDQVITQILFDFDAFEASISGENGKRFVIDNGVKRNDRTDQSFV